MPSTWRQAPERTARTKRLHTLLSTVVSADISGEGARISGEGAGACLLHPPLETAADGLQDLGEPMHLQHTSCNSGASSARRGG